MSIFVADPAAEPGSPGRGLFRLSLALLLVATLPLAYRGWCAWQEDDRLRSIAIGFLTDVSAGRKAQALGYLSGEYRRQVEHDWRAEFDRVWRATDDLSLRVMSVSRKDDSADIRVSVAKSGLAIHPHLHLRRSQSGDWKIVRIDHVDVDPHWQRWQEQQAEEDAAALADELAQKLDAELSNE